MKNKLECSEIILEEASKWYLHIKMLLYEKNFLFPMEVVGPVFWGQFNKSKITSDLFILFTPPYIISLLLEASKENISFAPQQPSRPDSIS